jgi:glucokinase
MGGGMVLNGELYTGNKFKASEYGHMILEPEGPLCNCGQRGCLETFSSKTGMTNYIRQQISRGRETMMAEFVRDGVFKSKKLKKALAAGDEVAIEAVDRACHYLAIATGNMINTISPDLIVYGGGVMEAVGDVFLEKILKELDRYCMRSIRPTVDIKIAELGDDSILYGELALIEQSM